jgi:hypothetical protein
MQTVLKFDLPEDRDECIAASHGMDYALSCWDMDQKLRGWLKYGHKFESADDALEECREQLREIMYDHGVTLDMIR